MSRRLARRNQAGFTLVELLTVVVIVGILAAVGIALLRQHVFSSKTTEVVAMVQSIRAAEERWRSENHGYLDVSQTLTSWYPMSTPDKTKYHWDQPAGNDYQKWRLLAPTVAGPVQAGYAVRAGPAFTPMLEPTTVKKPTWPAGALQNEPWYVIQAQADTDGDGTSAMFLASSLNGELYVENEGE
jgi:prepilin-type N-terminal cleavage/methylation domain-containing protein